jgi:acyl-coenzyme A synthetase/AMP-(fatty) acid ligase
MNVASRFIDAHVQANLGQRRALEWADKHYSYYDLAALANRAGNLLKSRGAGVGTRVLILMPESPGYVGSLIGAMKIGAVAVLSAADAGAKLAIVHSGLLGKLKSPLAKEDVLLAGEGRDGYPSFAELMRAQASSLAAAELPPEAPVLALENRQVSQRELDAALGDAKAAGLGRVGEVLRALAKAGTARLNS